ncbi:uncharacterized protein N7469_007039 [Penicillium citrinum]|uniref:PH domain-containing protein n=1 Tax=Penicillium citrinum TaxID=5077 RepID=A0A9W9NXZ1_PENCI|nr:uncharacterized protein N7469_007039 [Penicillium citrinum]KAJ5227033.1 hypothetical protein N7469_007039 [Penicillium citrinum]
MAHPPVPRENQRTPTLQLPHPSHLGPPPSRNGQVILDTFSPVNEHGSFAFDRVLKTGKVFRRVKHKHVFRASWKSAYLVLRPNLLSVYKDEETTRLRVSITLSEVTAVATVKTPRSNRKHVFGIFTPSKNYRFEALSERDAEDWIDRIRAETPKDEDEQALLALSNKRDTPRIQRQFVDDTTDHSDHDPIVRASSPEPNHAFPTINYPMDLPPTRNSRLRSMPSIHTLSISAPEVSAAEDKPISSSLPRESTRPSDLGILRDPERVVCQGYLQGLRIKGTVRQWKRLWVVLRPKTLAFYKDDQEYSALRIISMSQVIDAAEIDPMSRSKKFCLQLIAEEKTYRLCAPDEESLARWLGALKSIFIARKKLETTPAVPV